jgi:hypothetical protein
LKKIHYPAALVQAGLALDNSNKLLTVDSQNKVLACNDGFLFDRQDGTLIQYIQRGEKHLVVPDYIKSVGSMAFSGCLELETVTFTNADATIGKEAFYYCDSLRRVVLPARIQQLEPYLFWSCLKLDDVRIPSTVTTIKDGVFHKCESLVDVIVPDSVNKIGNHAFNGCTSLSNVSLPAGEIQIAKNAFRDCPKVKVAKRAFVEPTEDVIADP